MPNPHPSDPRLVILTPAEAERCQLAAERIGVPAFMQRAGVRDRNTYFRGAARAPMMAIVAKAMIDAASEIVGAPVSPAPAAISSVGTSRVA